MQITNENKSISRKSKEYKSLQKKTVDVASVLLEDGMLYGKALDDFLKVEAEIIGISDEEYNAFEECVLEYIERHKDYYIVTDHKKNEKIRFNTATDTADFLKTTVFKLARIIEKQILLNDRYTIIKVIPTVQDIAYKHN